MNEGVEKGSAALWTAIEALPPGVQIAFIVLLAVTVFFAWSNIRLAKTLDKERERILTALTENSVALALVREKLNR